MKIVTLLLGTVLSTSAFAASINFTYSGFENGRNSYYSCDYAESQTEFHLETLGATNIDVTCFGGITPFSIQPVSIRAKFDLPEVTGESSDVVEIEGDTWNPACGLNTTIINNILKKMKNVKVLKKRDSCAFATTNYYYKLDISK